MPMIKQSLVTLLLVSLAGMPATAQVRKGPPGPPPERMTEAEAIAALSAELAERVEEDRFSGAVLIARAGEPVFQQAYGYADREKKIPNSLDTKFIFGSMAKMFTGVSVMQLVQAGKIRLDDPISKYLPDYPNEEVAAATIHQLLTHTGGTGDIFGPEFEAHRLELKEHKDYVALYDERKPLFAPGSKFEYSNYGMVLLGRIIEVVSGRSYDDHVRDHILTPAGMTSTGNVLGERPVPGLAIPYTRLEPGQPPPRRGPGAPAPSGPMRPRTDMRHSGTAAGGGYSTVGDFLKFATALTANQLLDPHYSELVTTGKVELPTPPGANGRPKGRYAYGFMDALTPDGVRHVGHNGGSQGVNGALAIYPASLYVVVVLANLDPPAAGDIARFIESRLPLK
jgi:D-alanyl-D-alanine carboxypeptidase